MNKFDFQFYVRQENPHPSDTFREGIALEDAIDLFKAAIEGMGDVPSMFNCIINWRGADGERASIRCDSFMDHCFNSCLGHAEEPEVLAIVRQAVTSA